MPDPRFLLLPAAPALDHPDTIWHHSGERYHLPSDLAEKAPGLVEARTAGRPFENEPKISIAGLPLAPGDALVSRTACYFDQLATHDQPEPVRHGPLLAPLHLDPDGSLLELSASRFPNPLGGSVVAVCADGVVALGRRSGTSLVDAGSLDVTASGSFLAPTQDLTAPAREMIVSQVLRELEEETGVPPDAVRTAHVLGFGRYLGRGGLFNAQVLALFDLPSTHLAASDDLVELHFSPPTSTPAELAALIAAHRDHGPNLAWWDLLLSSPDPHVATNLAGLYDAL